MTTAMSIACTLDAGAYAERVAWIAALNRDALRAGRQYGLTLELTYDPSAADRVRALVRREKACCAFLSFDVAASAQDVVLRVVAPPETRDATDALFAPFLATDGEVARTQTTDACAAGAAGAAGACGCVWVRVGA